MPAALVFRAAESSDLRRLRRTLVAAGAFADDADLEQAWGDDPWRVQVSERGDAAVLGRWREHLDVLAIEALWCRERDIPDAISQLRGLALARGYGDLLGPPVPLAQVRPYESAGMRVFETVSTFRRALGRAEESDAAVTGARAAHDGGVTVREATGDDVDALLQVDAACFDDFWRYDRPHLERYLRSQRVALASGAEGPIGYTLSTVRRGDGLLGRVAVLPGYRGRGVGRLLVTDVVDALQRQGAVQVSLCTQTGNVAARALYAACGLSDVGQHVAFVRFGG